MISYFANKQTDEKVMLIKRKVPYCIQNFYIVLNDLGITHDAYNQNPFEQIKDFFEGYWLPHLSEHDQKDYFRFINGEMFEDMYDFPHGQLNIKVPKSILQCFMNAYREFREETGYRFSFIKDEVEKYPLLKIEFKGCDQHVYTQYFFIVENVKDLRRYRYFDSFRQRYLSTLKIRNWKDDRLVYQSYLTPVNEAFKLLKNQQYIKSDSKHLLLQETRKDSRCYRHNVNNWRCATCQEINQT